MTDPETISWIFLATAIATETESTSINGISAIADGINHAVPSHKEMQTSLDWLMIHGLIIKNGKNYSLSVRGKFEFDTASKNTEHVSDIWKILEVKFSDYKPM